MKPVSTLLILTLLAVMASCGKDNKSGKGNYGLNSLNTYGAYGGTSISYNGASLQQVINENPCVGGYNNNSRLRSTSGAAVNSVIPNGDVYVGVTSFGDVGVLVGTPNGPVFEAYICPRSAMSAQAGAAQGITLLPYTNCAFKAMNAKLPLPDGTVANFRAMDYGSSTGAKFSYCR